MLFSATLEGEVGRIAKAYTTNPRRHEHAHSAERKGDVEHRFVTVTHEGKVARLVSELGEAERGLTLVFVRTKRGADRLVKRLASSSVRAVAMHGDKSQGQRERALANFEAGVVDTLVATDVAARGIDVAGITHVINYDIPATREDYVHRIGRTARAGASGVGVTLVAHDQAARARRDGRRARSAIASSGWRGSPPGASHAASGSRRGRPRSAGRSARRLAQALRRAEVARASAAAPGAGARRGRSR